ncbi:MAG: UMP kinase [Oligoflexia bacterium]|nr:UMP kinase [Oligoflexia bacterium]
MRYKRILFKISGGALAGPQGTGFSPTSLDHICREILAPRGLGIELAVVVGGGNIFRGNVAEDWDIERAEADNIGMLGTVLNAIMLRAALTARGTCEARVMTAIRMESIAEPFIRLRAIKHLEKGTIVVFGGGIGQPYVTTDYTGVQRAIETRCDAVLIAKQGVDGVYTSDPKADPSARRFQTLSYTDALDRDIRVMDQSAMLLARDHGLPLHVFDFDKTGCVRQICQGEDIGTLLGPNTRTRLAD